MPERLARPCLPDQSLRARRPSTTRGRPIVRWMSRPGQETGSARPGNWRAQETPRRGTIWTRAAGDARAYPLQNTPCCSSRISTALGHLIEVLSLPPARENWICPPCRYLLPRREAPEQRPETCSWWNLFRLAINEPLVRRGVAITFNLDCGRGFFERAHIVCGELDGRAAEILFQP